MKRICPSCGATLKHNYNHRCEYCRNYIDLNLPEAKTKKFNIYDLREVQYIKFEIDQLNLDYILYFQGKVFPDIKVLEYDGKNTFVSMAFDRNEYDKKVSCAIRLERKEIEHYGYIEYIIKSNFNYHEAEKILNQISKDFGRYYL